MFKFATHERLVGRPMEILLVEDDWDDARATLEILQQGEVRVRVTLVRDGEEALLFLRREKIFARVPRPDLVLLSLHIRKCNAGAVLCALRTQEEFKSIPVVGLAPESAREVPPDDHGCLPDEIVTKPLRADRFAALVKSRWSSLLTEFVRSPPA